MSVIRTYNNLRRLRQITNVLVKEELGYIVDQLKRNKPLSFKKAKEPAQITPIPERLRRAAENLGGTFVKFGQILSMRYDLLPAEYCDEFSKLQDRVAADPFSGIQKIMESELGKPLEEIFSYFDKIPLAAASVGQVYKARLKTGEEVAVKVQRPNMDLVFKMDIDIMRYLAKKATEHYPELERFNILGLVDTFEDYTRKELDYMIEARNIDDFYKNFKGSKTVVIPKVYWDYTKKRVIVMSFINGTRFQEIKDLKKLHSTKQKVIQNIIDAEVSQIFDYGLFHADPHTGNIFVLPNNKVAFLDFGIVGRLTEDMIEHVEDLLFGLVMNDADMIVKALIDSGSVDGEVDEKKLKIDIHDLLGSYHNTNLNQLNIKEFFLQILHLADRHDIHLPLNFSLLAKAFVTLEGLASKYDPSFNFAGFMKPRVLKIMRQRSRPEYILDKVKDRAIEIRDFILDFPSEFRETLRALRQGTNTTLEIKELKKFSLEIDKSSNRVTFGLILAALIVATALLMQTGSQAQAYRIPFIAYIPLIFIVLISLTLIISIVREGKER